MTMLFIGSHATRTSSGNSQRGIFISPRYQLITGIIYRKKRQFKRAIPACHGQKPWARHGQRKLAATVLAANPGRIAKVVDNPLFGGKDIRNQQEFFEMELFLRNLLKQNGGLA